MELIQNNSPLDHCQYLKGQFEKANEIHIAVAFFRLRGFELLKMELMSFCKRKDTKLTFYIGLGQGVTEPKALEELYKLFKDKKRFKLILCQTNTGIFHPKVFLFNQEDKVNVLTGSANLTHHGLLVNDELSLAFETTTDAAIYKSYRTYFKNLEQKYKLNNVAAVIARYKNQLENYNKKHANQPRFRFLLKDYRDTEIPLEVLDGYYEKYKASDRYVNPLDREGDYITAKGNLDIMASDEHLSKKQFHELFGPLVGHKGLGDKLWHSGGIHRHTYRTVDHHKNFRALVREAKENINKPIGETFGRLKASLDELRKAKQMYGMGVNILAEVLLTLNPKQFANLNENPLAVLYELGLEYPAPDSFKSEDYLHYMQTLTQIKEHFEFKTFLEIDSFFNYAYWNLLEE